MTKTLGRHLLLEFYGCDFSVINDRDQIRSALIEAAKRAQATIVTDIFHRFNPHGISGVVVIAESHLAIHTWPEYRCASVDMFSCSERMQPEVVEGFLKDVFRAQKVVSMEIERGKIPLPMPKENSVEPSL